MKEIFQKIKKIWKRIPGKDLEVPRVVWLSFLFLLLIMAGGFGWIIYRYKVYENRAAPAARQEQIKKDTAKLIKLVGRHVLLPVGEEPKMATIVDAEKLRKDQPDFYANAKNGDEVLIYFISKKAFIYDPVNDIVINIGPVLLEKVQ